jgi:beta-phosphoglucomutase-like phosphatase (HAD superfamily)
MPTIRAVLLGRRSAPRISWSGCLGALCGDPGRADEFRIEPAADILDLIRSLRSSGVSVSLATNQQAHRANFMTNSLGYRTHFDHLLYSCELRFSKPSVEYFSSALATIAMDPSEVLFINDHEANVSAARSCGLYEEVFHLSEGVGRIHGILTAGAIVPA